MKRTPLQRKTRLTAKHSNGKPKVPLKKVNVERQAKRKARMRKWYASPEWKRQRAESLELAGHRCQYAGDGMFFRRVVSPSVIEYEPARCIAVSGLQVHEIRYKFEKSTPADRIVYCKEHHELVEMRDHPTRRHGR